MVDYFTIYNIFIIDIINCQIYWYDYELKNNIKFVVYIYLNAEEVDLYRWLVDHIEHYHTDITLVIPKLLSGKPETKPLFDGTALREVSSLSLLMACSSHFIIRE